MLGLSLGTKRHGKLDEDNVGLEAVTYQGTLR